MPDPLIVEHFAVGPLACTCTIVADRTAGEAIVVDGGDDAETIAARLEFLAAIRLGLDQIERGETMPHEEVKRELASWLSK